MATDLVVMENAEASEAEVRVAAEEAVAEEVAVVAVLRVPAQ
jgi:hypothetical protein